MKMLTALVLLVLLTGSASAQQYTRGYTRSNGTYVQGYYHTAPDGNLFNNYSTQGNVNPYTGQLGTVNPYNQGSQYAQPVDTTPFHTRGFGY